MKEIWKFSIRNWKYIMVVFVIIYAEAYLIREEMQQYWWNVSTVWVLAIIGIVLIIGLFIEVDNDVRN